MRVSNFGPLKKTESNQRQIARYEYKNRAGRKKEKRKKRTEQREASGDQHTADFEPGSASNKKQGVRAISVL